MVFEVGDSLYGWKPPVVEGGTGLDQLPELGYCEAVSRLFIGSLIFLHEFLTFIDFKILFSCLS